MYLMSGKGWSDAPDPQCVPDRLVVDVSTSATRTRGKQKRSIGLKQAIELIAHRRALVADVLMLDGPEVLLAKARHMFRREGLNFQHQIACFAGNISADATSAPLAVGTRVAGFSLTHPSLASKVVTRREQIWPIADDFSEELAAITLFGGVAFAAARIAITRTDGPVGILGSSVSAELVALALETLGAKPARLAIQTSTQKLLITPVENVAHLASLPVWIADASAEAQQNATGTVIGCGLDEAALAGRFPAARERMALDEKELTRSITNHFDLYYFDGPCEYPAWFDLEDCGRYLKAAARLRPHVSDGKLGEFKFTVPPKQSHASPAGPPVNEKIEVGLIGGGRWPLGMIVRQMALQKDVALRTVSDRRPEVAWLAQNALPFAQTTSRNDDVFDDPSIDVVVVAPYHGVHAPLAARALRAGKHCFVEKPPIVSREQFLDLADAALGTDRYLHVGYNRPFAPASLLLRKHLAEEKGPVTLNFAMRAIDLPENNWYYWPSNGNRIISNVCHLLDYAVFLCDHTDPISVTATPAAVGRRDNNISVTLLFADGSLANMVYTNRGRVRSGYLQRYLVARGSTFGELDDFTRLTVHRRSKKIGGWRGVQDSGHRGQVSAFVDAIRKNNGPPVPLRRMLISEFVLMATAQSAETGLPVKIDPAEADRMIAVRTAARVVVSPPSQ